MWRLLAADAVRLSEYAGVLSDEERERAERRLPGRVRDEFVQGRVALRLLLAANLEVKPHAIALHYADNGKPGLLFDSGLDFNLSHSHGVLLMALSRSGVVGVDVEFEDRQTTVEELASMVFSPQERKRFRVLASPEARRSAFYRTWVRKEAMVKADGRGLAVALTDLETGWEPQQEGMPSMSCCVEGKCYFLKDIAVSDQFAASIALTSHDCRITLMNFPVPTEESVL